MALPMAAATCMRPFFSVSAIPTGAVTIMVVQSWRKLRRETPHAVRYSSIVGFEVHLGLGMQPSSVASRFGLPLPQAVSVAANEYETLTDEPELSLAASSVRPLGDLCHMPLD